MVLQLPGSYTDLQPIGIEGQTATRTHANITTGVNESAAMPFGRMVAFDSTGTTDRSVKLTNNVADVLFGVTYFQHFGTQFDLTTGTAQQTEITTTAPGNDGTYSFEISVDEGVSFVLISLVSVGNTETQIAAALVLLVNAEATLSQVLTASNTLGVLELTRDTPGSFLLRNVATTGSAFVATLVVGGANDGVPANDAANILRSGTILVRPEDAVTPATVGVFVRVVANTGVGTALGGFRGVTDGANTRDISAVARWATSSQGGADGALAQLILNLPNV